MYCLIYILFACSFSKKICFTTQTFNYNCYDGESILNVNKTTDIASIISDKIEESDTEVTISLYSNFEYSFPVNIFNSKKVNILFSSSSTGNFDISDIKNIDLNLQGESYSLTNVRLHYNDPTLIALESSISLTNIAIMSDITEIQLKSLSIQKSTFPFTKIFVNSMIYQINDKNIEINNNDDDITIENETFSFIGENQNFTIILSSKNDLIFNNYATDKSISYFNFNSIQSITFNGNSFLDSCKLAFKECSKIITNIDLLPISSFSLGSSFYPSNLEIEALKSLSIKGKLTFPSSANIIFSTNSNCSSRISISVESISLNSGSIQFKSSWIDFNVDSFTFNSQNLQIYPCVGYGGSSIATFNHFNYIGSNTLTFNNLNINLDVSGQQTDETLSLLMSKEWNAIVLKSFTSISAAEKYDRITYNPNDINGFNDEPSILSATSKISDDFILTLKVSSYTTVPLLLCYSSSSSCSYGTAITDLTQLPKMIPNGQKMINLTITKSGAEIDLSEINTTGATFTISSSYSSYYISSLKMSEPSENANIDYLVLKSTSFYTGVFELNAKEIDITSLSLYASSKPTISIEEQSVLNIDINSLKSICSCVAGTFPLTKVNGISSNYYTSLEITDSEYILKGLYYSDVQYPKNKFSHISYQIQVSSSYSFPITTSTTSVGSITVQFVPYSAFSSSTNIQVTFNNLTNLVSAGKICIDFGSFNNSIIDLKNFPMKSYFDFIGNNIQILNQGISSDSTICTCKELPCNECPQDLSPVTFDELNQRIQEISSDEIQITIIGADDGSSPILSLSNIDNKDTTIIGSGTNPKIQFDCSTSFTNETKTIEISKITVVAHSSENNNLHMSNLKLYSDCIIDSTFNEIPLIVGSLDCDISHLAFKSILIHNSLVLSGDPSNSQSSTKISFENSSKFEFVLPATITINGPHLTFSNLQFDLSNVIPLFSIDQKLNQFNIIGVDGNIETIGSNIVIDASDSLQSLHIFGTWIKNENPSKSIIFNDIQSEIHLQSLYSPISIQSGVIKSIIIEKENVGIAGNLTIGGGSNYKISSTVTGKSSIHIQEIYASSNVNLQLLSPTIDIVINTIRPGSKSIKFYLKIGLDEENKVDIINKIDDYQFDYEVDCIVSGSLKDEKVKAFIEQNHTLIVVNNETNIKTPSDSNLKFINAPQGFNNNNFKLIVDRNELVFYTYQSPYESEINLYYGYCFLCSGTEITDEDLSQIENFVPSENTSLAITFAKSIPSDIILDFAKDDIKHLKLKLLKSSSFSSLSLNIPVKFGSSVSSLTVDSAIITVSENDDFSIENAELRNANFSQPENYNHINSLSVSLNSLFELGITEFSNQFNIIFDSSSFSINYTNTGIKIVPDSYSSFNPFDIDVSKFTNVNLVIKGSPIINLEEGVTELKQINLITFDFNTINIGLNWNQSFLSSSKIKYELTKPINEITVITCSFPFESWDFMYGSQIAFDSSLSPYKYDHFTLNNRSIILKTSTGSYSSYTITFNDVVMLGNSSITCIQSNNGKLVLENVTVNGHSNIIDVQISNELTLKEGSSINGKFMYDNTLVLNIEWNLYEMSLFNPSKLQDSIPQSVNVIYTGPSISGKEGEFNSFLSNGIVIMKNVDDNVLDNINFTSSNEILFEDGENLSLKCQIINDNEVQLLTSRSLINGDDLTTSSEEEQPTSNDEKPITDEYAPSIDDSFISTGNNVLYNEDGYYDDDKFVSTKGNQNDILLAKTDKQELTITTNSDGKPNSKLFVSPQKKNAVITVSSQNKAYGSGQVGVHSNSNNPTINLPQTEVPLNVFNNEQSSLNLILNSNSNSQLLDEDVKISLGKLILCRGNLQMKMQNEKSKIKFENIEAYLNNSFNALSNQDEVDILVGTLKMNPYSSVTSSNLVINNKIITMPHSKIEFKDEIKFNKKSIIELSDSSFIEFGESEIEGVCKEIKIKREKSADSLEDSQEIDAKLICGKHFDCSEWKEKYTEDSIYKYAKCVKENDEVCLVASNKNEKGSNKTKKNKLSGGAIAGIIIAVVVVLICIIVLVVMLQKKTIKRRNVEYVENDNSLEEELAKYL